MLIALLGDVMLGRLVNDRLKAVPAEYPWGDTLPVLRSADVRIANLECVLTSGGEPAQGKTFHFRSDPKNVQSLRRAGIDLVSLANNHVLDFGPDAFREMPPLLDAAGILHAGAGMDAEAARRPAVLRAAGITVGFIAFTDNQPDWEADHQPGVHYVPVGGGDRRTSALLELVRRTRPRAGLLIVSAHWGANWGSAVPSEHRTLAHALVDAGADVVYGHSPHIFRGVEIYRHCPIIYSAGDFLDDYAVDPVERNDHSFIFLLDTEGTTHRAVRLHPTLIVDFQARLAGAASRGIAHRMQRLCAPLGTRGIWREQKGCLEITVGGK